MKQHNPEFLRICEAARKNVREIQPADVQTKITSGEDLVLVDVREDREWDAGHAKTAVHLGRGVIERDIEKTIPDKEKMVILYCGGGYRSALAGDSIQKMGYTNVFSMAGGWSAWVRENLPKEN